jgi:hypothetical protein
MKQLNLFKVDEDGFPIGVAVVEFDDSGNILTQDVDDNVVLTPCPNSFHRPIWTGEEWIESLTQEEIEELKKQVGKETSFEELQLEYNIDLDYRLSILEMGLI